MVVTPAALAVVRVVAVAARVAARRVVPAAALRLRSAALVAAAPEPEPPLFSNAEPGVTGVAWTIGIVGVGCPPAREFEPTGGAL